MLELACIAQRVSFLFEHESVVSGQAGPQL